MRKESKPNSKIVSESKLNELKAKACKILSNCRQTLLTRQPFIGTIAMSFNIKPTRDKRLETAATDGKNIYFDIDYLSRLTEDEIIFTLAHEIWHNVMCHFLREEGRDRSIWNIATDIEINELLVKDGLIIPKGLCTAKAYNVSTGLSAEDYYEQLMNNKMSQNANNNQSAGFGNDFKGNSSNNGQSIQFDKHIYKNDRSEFETGHENVDDKYGKVEYDPDYQPNVNEQSVEQVREAAISAAQSIERQGGTLSNHLKRLVNKMLEPQIPWQEVLCQFVSKCHGVKSNWNIPNRRFVHSRTYLPSRQDNCINIVVGIDVSASTDTYLPKFLGELNGLVKSFAGYTINLIEADYKVCKHEIYNDERPLDLENEKYTANGGGGTELHSILNYVEDNQIDADAIIMFTDGENYSEFYEDECPSIPVLWMITKNGTDKYIHFGEILKL